MWWTTIEFSNCAQKKKKKNDMWWQERTYKAHLCLIKDPRMWSCNMKIIYPLPWRMRRNWLNYKWRFGRVQLCSKAQDYHEQKCGLLVHDLEPNMWEALQFAWYTFWPPPGISNVDEFLLNQVKKKLDFWVKARLSLAWRVLLVNGVLISSLCYFIGTRQTS